MTGFSRLVRWLGAVGAVILLASCQSSEGPTPVADPTTTRSAPSSTPGIPPLPDTCPSAQPGPGEAGEVLIPGPSNGLSPSDTAGEPMVLEATVLDPDCQPAPGALVNLWHTDAAGHYGTEQTDCCFYQVTGRADGDGRFRLETIRPGQYAEPNAPPAHIHLEITHAAGRHMSEVVFAGDPGLPASAGQGDGRVVVELTETDDGWHGTVTFILAP